MEKTAGFSSGITFCDVVRNKNVKTATSTKYCVSPKKTNKKKTRFCKKKLND